MLTAINVRFPKADIHASRNIDEAKLKVGGNMDDPIVRNLRLKRGASGGLVRISQGAGGLNKLLTGGLLVV